jgi:hypothetical protein
MLRIFDPIRRRAIFLASMWRGSIVAVLLSIVWAIVGAFPIVRDDFVEPKHPEKWHMIDLIPHIPLSWWLVGVLAIIFVSLFEAAYQKQRPGMALSFNSKKIQATWSREPDKPIGPLTMVLLVKLSNNSNVELEKCIIQLRIKSYDNPYFTEFSDPYQVSKPFSLVLDQTEPVPIMSYAFDGPDLSMIVELARRKDTQLMLPPGRYDIWVEAISSHSRIDRVKLKLDFKDGNWAINGRSLATRESA